MDRKVYPNRTTFKSFKTRFFENPGISKSNQEAVREFINKQQALGVGERRIRKLLSTFTRILVDIYPEFDLVKANEKDINLLHKKIHEWDFKPNTKADYVKIIRRYYRVMEGRNSRYPEKLDFFKPKKIVTITKSSRDVISREEFRKLLGQCINMRDKCICWILFEGGLRIGELVNQDFRDIIFTEDGVDIQVTDKLGNKTGARPVPLVESYRAVKDWVDAHPTKKPDDPLFLTLEKKGRWSKHNRVTPWTVSSMLHKKARRAGLDESKFHPHNFRHTACTEKAVLGFTESQHSAFFGHGSEMAKVYIHMSGTQVRQFYKEKLGVAENGGKQKKICPKCYYEDNPFLSVECSRCGTSLDKKHRIEIRDSALQLAKILQQLKEKDDDIFTEFKNHIEKLG